jgi:hypothetical protein
MPEKTPEEQTNQTLQSIGNALMGVQLVEHLIGICLDLVFKPSQPFSAQDLENLGILERRETLGRLLRELRKEVEVHPELIEYLNEFLDQRNRLVHRLLEIPDFHLSSGPGYEELKVFVTTVTINNARLARLFMAVIRRYQLQKMPNATLQPELKELFEFSDPWVASLESLFGQRSAPEAQTDS